MRRKTLFRTVPAVVTSRSLKAFTRESSLEPGISETAKDDGLETRFLSGNASSRGTTSAASSITFCRKSKAFLVDSSRSRTIGGGRINLIEKWRSFVPFPTSFQAEISMQSLLRDKSSLAISVYDRQRKRIFFIKRILKLLVSLTILQIFLFQVRVQDIRKSFTDEALRLPYPKL